MLEQLEFKTAPARPENCVVNGKVRVSFLTPRLVRFEYASDGRFEDRESLAVMNRDLGAVELKVKWRGAQLRIESSELIVELDGDGSTPLNAENCRAFFKLSGSKITWHPGAANPGNLHGTIRTLDQCIGDRHIKWDKNQNPGKGKRIDLGNGFISRDGWNVIDDSSSAVYDLVNGAKWVVDRPEGERQDFYLFAYGHDYRQALADAAEVFGSQPLPPRFTLGYWFSRYWAYSDREIEEIIDTFDEFGVPIDVMVVDMDWHLEGWTGYTWDRRYFPDPDEFLAELHRRGCKVTLNLHPAKGVGRHEAQFPAMAAAMGVDPAKCDRIELDLVDQRYVKNYFELLHHPEERRGIDFWWMDWQQGQKTRLKGLDPLPWLNHLHWEDMQKRGRRPLIFSRYGGPGSGRYAVGFSGDTYSNWESLAYQPYFTATAANILYGYWSHDIGGHMPGKIEPELYLRWVQFGAYSPVLRTHTTKNFESERRFFAYPQPYASLMAAVTRRRYELVPYIYSENRRAFETGISLCRGLYYDYPEEDNAYKFKNEYFFGGEMIVNPVTVPVSDTDGLARVASFLPPGGRWFDTVRGELVDGGQVIRRGYAIDEMPVFVREGAIIPGCVGVRRLNDACFPTLLVEVYPGEAGEYRLYEDDGISADYPERFAEIRLAHFREGAKRVVEVRRSRGDYPGFLTKRAVEFRIHAVMPPRRVRLDGRELGFDYRLAATGEGWRYDGVTFTLVIRAAEIDVVAGARLEIEYPQADEFAPVAGRCGLLARLRAVALVCNSYELNGSSGADERLAQQLAHTGERIARKPDTCVAELAALDSGLKRLGREISRMLRVRKFGTEPGSRGARLKALLRDIAAGR